MPQLASSKGVYENQPTRMHPKSTLYPCHGHHPKPSLQHLSSGDFGSVLAGLELCILLYSSQDDLKLQIGSCQPPSPTPVLLSH